MEFFTMIISILLTGLAYVLVPLLVSALRKKPITRKKHLVFVLIESFSVFFIFAIIYGLLGTDGSPKVSALIIWANTSYYVGLLVLKRNQKLLKEASVDEISPSNTDSKYPQFCHKCGSKLPADSNYCNKCGTRIREE